MTFSRLAIVTRRFWPVAGPAETALADLAEQAASAGYEVCVFSAQWEKTWPQELKYRNFRVQRVPKPFKGIWGSFRYLRSLVRRVAEFNPDHILTSGLGEESWSVARAFSQSMPVVARVDQAALGGLTGKNLRRKTAGEVLRLCHSVTTNCPATTDGLLAQASEHFRELLTDLQAKTTVVPDIVVVDSAERRTRASQIAARSSLSDAHPVLITKPGQPLVLSACCLDSDEGVFDLLDAWPQVLKRYPKARLWIAGDGRLGPRLWQKITERDLVYSVILPGFFDDLTEAFHAADLYVHPLRRGGPCSNLTRAIRSGLCCVATVSESAPPSIEHQVSGIAVPANQPGETGQAILTALSDQGLRDRLGAAGQRQSQSHHNKPPEMIDYLQQAFRTPDKRQPQAVS